MVAPSNRRLTAKNQDELQLLEELREYLKRRAEIESTYQEQLSKLAMQFLAIRKKSAKHNAAGEERKYVAGGAQDADLRAKWSPNHRFPSCAAASRPGTPPRR